MTNLRYALPLSPGAVVLPVFVAGAEGSPELAGGEPPQATMDREMARMHSRARTRLTDVFILVSPFNYSSLYGLVGEVQDITVNGHPIPAFPNAPYLKSTFPGRLLSGIRSLADRFLWERFHKKENKSATRAFLQNLF
jgi:hypothetical protein